MRSDIQKIYWEREQEEARRAFSPCCKADIYGRKEDRKEMRGREGKGQEGREEESSEGTEEKGRSLRWQYTSSEGFARLKGSAQAMVTHWRSPAFPEWACLGSPESPCHARSLAGECSGRSRATAVGTASQLWFLQRMIWRVYFHGQDIRSQMKKKKPCKVHFKLYKLCW